jgi:hypothetical protein
MKKMFFIFAIAIANSVLISCTDIDENLENEPTSVEIFGTEGEEGHNPIEEENPANGV